MNEKTSPSIVWHGSQVSREDRQAVLNQQAITLWLTGLSAAGKSTLAFALEHALMHQGYACYVLNGDNVRHGLNQKLGFSPEDRTENIRRIAEVACLMNDAGLIVITAFISPYRADRAAAREIIGPNRFREAFVSTTLSVCELRDPKGLYLKAREGTVAEFTGISSPYEVPVLPDWVIDTAQLSLEESVSQLMPLAARRPLQTARKVGGP